MTRAGVYVMRQITLSRLKREGRSICYMCEVQFKVGDRVQRRYGRQRLRVHEGCVEASRV